MSRIARLGFLADEDKYLDVAPQIRLPYDIATLTIAFLAMRGSGKTYAALALVEEMILHGLHVACIDPVGVMWGLRSSADGKSEGLPVIILGGDHGDVPLEVTAGSAVADFIMESRQPCVIDLSLFRKGEQTRFMCDFAERLYHKNRNPIHLVLDEADAWCPQKPMHEQARLLGAMEDLVRRGRARGIGVSLISQRPAVINKNVLTQIECLIALRMTGPQDISAIKQWIHHHGTEEDQEKVLSSLSSLPRGTAWFWSPGWLKVLKKIEFRKRKTFDSSATPAPGKTIAIPEEYTKVDIEALKEKLAATIERAKEDDPKALKERVRELEDKLGKAGVMLATPMPETVREVEIERVPAKLYAELLEVWQMSGIALNGALHAFSQVGQIGQHLERLKERHERLGQIVESARFKKEAANVGRSIRKEGALYTPDISEEHVCLECKEKIPNHAKGCKLDWVNFPYHGGEAPIAFGPLAPIKNLKKNPAAPDGAGYLSVDKGTLVFQSSKTGETSEIGHSILRGEKRVLLALAELGGKASKTDLAICACYKASAGGFQNVLSNLRTKKLIDYESDGVRMTHEGVKQCPPPDGRSHEGNLLNEWKAKLGKPARLALDVLASVKPNALSPKEIADRIGYVANAGGFQNGLSELRANRLVETGERKKLRLARVLA